MCLGNVGDVGLKYRRRDRMDRVTRSFGDDRDVGIVRAISKQCDQRIQGTQASSTAGGRKEKAPVDLEGARTSANWTSRKFMQSLLGLLPSYSAGQL